MELVAASSRTTAELARAFSAGYEGYFVPVALDEATFSFMASAWDYDLDASRVALEQGQPVGIAMLGRRGPEGWVGGVGVLSERRGAGIGRSLMDGLAAEAKARGVARLWLEVLVQNETALRLYERLGYRHVRDLDVWTLDELEPGGGTGAAAPAEVARERIRAVRDWREPWQRSDESVANHGDAEGLAGNGGAILFRRSGARASVLQAAADDEAAARDLLRSLPVGTSSVGWLNGTPGHPLGAALESLGGAATERQHELVLEL